MNPLKKHWNSLLDLFDGKDAPGEPVYEPVHVAGVVVGCFTALGALFWLLWALLVCEGGLFAKVGPIAQIIFTSKTLKDFGYEGYPYAMGIFEGWIVNVSALVLSVGVLSALWLL